MRKIGIGVLIALTACGTVKEEPRVFDVTAFGATGDGVTECTAAVQAATGKTCASTTAKSTLPACVKHPFLHIFSSFWPINVQNSRFCTHFSGSCLIPRKSLHGPGRCRGHHRKEHWAFAGGSSEASGLRLCVFLKIITPPHPTMERWRYSEQIRYSATGRMAKASDVSPVIAPIW